MRVGKIEGVTVTQVIIASSPEWAASALGGAWQAVDDDVGVGWSWDEGAGAYLPPPAPIRPPRTRLTRLEFRNRLTQGEKEAVYTAAASSVAVQIWLDDLAAAEFIELTDPATIGAVTALEQLGLIASGRAAEILEGI